MGYSITAANQALDSQTGGTVNVLAFTNLCPSDPGTTGSVESASTRQACSWGAASARSKANTTALTFTGHAAGTAQTWVRTDSASSGGTFGWGIPLGTSVTAATITIAAGGLTLTA